MNTLLRSLPVLLIPIVLSAQRPVPIDNEWARVVLATSGPGPKGRMHKHDVNRVMVYLDKGAQRIEYQDGSIRDIPFQPGDVKWDPKGGLHTSENTGGTTFRIVEVELKKEGAPSSGTKATVPVGTKLELENQQVRILRVKLRLGQRVEGTTLLPARIVVPLTPIDLQTGADASLKGKPGDAIFEQPRPGSSLKNRLQEPVEFLLIELKG